MFFFSFFTFGAPFSSACTKTYRARDAVFTHRYANFSSQDADFTYPYADFTDRDAVFADYVCGSIDNLFFDTVRCSVGTINARDYG